MSLVDSYLANVHAQMRFRAIHPINTKLAIGDFGTFQAGRFAREGNLASDVDMATMGGPIAVQSMDQQIDGRRYNNKFTLGQVRAIEFGANANVDGVVKAKAGLSVSFNSDFSAFVSMAGMKVVTMRNLKAAGDELVNRAGTNLWAYNNRFVITQLVTASSMILLISSREGTRVELEAKGEVPQVDLADAELSFRLVYNDTGDSQYFPAATDGPAVTPFYWVHGVDRGPFGWFHGGFNPAALEAAPELQFRSDSDPLHALLT